MMEALLSKDPITTCLYRRKSDGKFLVCKSKYNKKIGLPIVKILVSSYNVQYGKATSKDISVQVVNTFRKEFGLDPEILNYYEGTKTSFVNNGVIANGNNMAFDMTDAGEYKGKPTITQNPSGDYTEVQWMSYNQILELVKTNSFDPSSLYYVLRSREQRRYTPIMSNKMKMRMYADKNGIKQHLNPTDNTLFKTLNNNGLKIWEETEDYWIYMDKDVVTTTVQQYVVGAFDRYLEMNRTIDSNISLLKSYNIEWTTEDKCRLFESINNSMLNELASQASDLGIEDSQPLVLEPKTVPIEYLCCFRVDKETKEFYAEEGYENIKIQNFRYANGRNHTLKYDINTCNLDLKIGTDHFDVSVTNNSLQIPDITSEPIGTSFTLHLYTENMKHMKNINGYTHYGSTVISRYDLTDSDRTKNKLVHTSVKENGSQTGIYFYLDFNTGLSQIGDEYNLKLMITKTATEKPFIQSIIPDCKITLNGIDPTTHTVLYKEPVSLYNDTPDGRMVLNLYADEKGLVFINNMDKMPIQIANGKTIQECLVESTPTYDIYCDGGTQTVMGYSGLAQKYIEALNTIYTEETKRGFNIQDESHPTSSLEFHHMLIDTLNQEHIDEVERNQAQLLKTRNVLEEQPVAPMMAEQRIFIAINFALYVDKENKCLYIGEGFENLIKTYRNDDNIKTETLNDSTLKITSLQDWTIGSGYWRIALDNVAINQCCSFDLIENTMDKVRLAGSSSDLSIGSIKEKIIQTHNNNLALDFTCLQNNYIKIKNLQVTSSVNFKPFVRSMFPSGKLAFITNVTSLTHSFAMKELDGDNVGQTITYLAIGAERGTQNFAKLLHLKNKTQKNVVFSKLYTDGVSNNDVGQEIPLNILKVGERSYNWSITSFKQLLIYKSNLNEAELKSELAKDITLKNYQNRFAQTNNFEQGEYGVHTVVGRFKEILLYEGLLTEQEKQNEINKLETISFEKPLDIVKDGLVCWLDARDGSGTQTTWVDRSGNGNNATLVNSNFDNNSGWTGKGLKLDGVNDYVHSNTPFVDWATLEIDFRLITNAPTILLSVGAFWGDKIVEIAGFGNYIRIQKIGYTKDFPIKDGEKNTFSISYMNGMLKQYVNGILVSSDATTILPEAIIKIGTNCLSEIFGNCYFHSLKLYNRALTESEIQQNYAYEQSIDRTTPVAYPLFREEKSYGIGLASQLTEEQLKTFRLSVDKTKFVAGLRYCEGLEVTEYTYSETLAIMDTEEWSAKEEV